MVRKISRLKPAVSSHFITAIAVISLLALLVVYYWARINNKFGLKSFTQFTLEQCREPIILIPKAYTDSMSADNQWKHVEDSELGISFTAPADWTIDSSCGKPFCLKSPNLNYSTVNTGARISVVMYPKNQQLPGGTWKLPNNLFDQLQSFFSCNYFLLNGQPVIGTRNENFKDFTVSYVEGNQANYVIQKEIWSDDMTSVTNQIFQTFRSIPIKEKIVGNTGPYDGIPSPVIPYSSMQFQDIPIQNIQSVKGNFQTINTPEHLNLAGYTFVAHKYDAVSFQLFDANGINGFSDAEMELYGYGPTVLRGETYMEFRAPITGRYFLVVRNLTSIANASFQLNIRTTR
jgi:hypothetical protein